MPKKRITADDLRKIDRPYITPVEAAAYLGGDPCFIRAAAREKPELLGYPVSVVGKITKIPKEPFLRYWGETT